MSRYRLLVFLTVVAFVLATSQIALAWTTPSTIDNFGDSDVPSTSLVVAPGGGTFVAWANGGDELFWSKKTASGWKRTQVAGQGTFTGCWDFSFFNTIGPSAAFTSTGDPKIASACMAVGGGAKIQYSQVVNGVWKTKTIGYGPSTGGSDASANTIALALSPTNKPSIVMTEVDARDITRFRLVKGVWQRQTLVKGISVCCGSPWYKMVAAKFDPVTGLLGVAWTTRFGSATSLEYGEFDASGTAVGGIEAVPLGSANVYLRPSLDFLSDGDVAIAVQEGVGSNLSLAIARRTSGVWSFATVDNSVANMGANPSLAIENDHYYVAYPDDTNGDLLFATSSDGLVWTKQTVTSVGDVGDVPSIGVSATGGVRISYYDLGATALRYTSGP